jgi:hypothetical protein
MFVRTILIALICGFLPACKGDRITGLKVEGGDRPTFVFSGGGWLTGLTVRDGNDVVWEIKPEKSDNGARHVADIGVIQYGAAPASYQQVRPVSGIAPTLLEGRTYLTMAYTTGSSFGRVVFTIQDGKAVAEGAK